MDAERHYHERLAVFRDESPSPGGIVFVGSSHIERFPVGPLLPGWPIVNRGIACDRIGIEDRGIRHRLDVSVFDCKPSFVLFENGGNDLGELWRHGRPAIEEIVACFDEVIRTIRRRLPDVPVCIVNVPPTAYAYADLSPLVPLLNPHIEQIARRHGCSLMDLYSVLVDARGELRNELTEDGLHFNDIGYAIWARRIETELHRTVPEARNP